MVNEKDFLYFDISFGRIRIIDKYIGLNDTRVEIPNTIDGVKILEIGQDAFNSHKEVKEIIIPEGVEIIGNFAFAGCSNLEKIFLPESIRKISPYAIVRNNSFKHIVFNGTKEQWDAIVSQNRELGGAKVKFNYPSKLSDFLNNCKERNADEIRKE